MNRQKYAMERAKLLFGSYRRGDANEPEMYVLAVATVLAIFDEDVIREATDPRTGISTREKFRAFPPNSGELKAFCEELATRRERIRSYSDLPRPNERVALPAPPPRPGRCANLLVPQGAPRYAEMCERAKTADPAEWEWHPRGIKVSQTWWFGGLRDIEPFRHLDAK